jgi:hypothetical protein
MFKSRLSVIRLCAFVFVASFWLLAVLLVPAARAQTLQSVSINAPVNTGYKSAPQDLSQTGTPASSNLMLAPNLMLAYDNWPAAQDQTRTLSGGVLSVTFAPSDVATAASRKTYAPLKRAQGLGLAALRLKLNVFAHMDNAGQIAPDYLEALESTINEALDAGAIVILAEANAYECSRLPEACQAPLLQTWTQLAERFRNAPPRLVFELLTDPSERLTADKWNPLAASLIAQVRLSNPLRNLLIAPGPSPTGTSFLADLNGLALPEADRHIILSLRYNDPLALSPVSTGDIQTLGLETVSADMNELAAWSRHKDRPILLNEIGTANAEQMRYRTHWLAGVIRIAQDKGLGWGLGEGARKLDAHDLDLRAPEMIQQASGQAVQVSGR